MCGIVGIASLDFSVEPEEKRVKKMMDTIEHRGPDDEGKYLDGPVGMGFRRLSIIDLKTGHQPLSNEDGTVWITFNGEIYNYSILREELIEKGHLFETKTDTETIVHLYEEYGTEAFSMLRGMFAIAIWDANKRRLICVRDRMGIKPFYYKIDDNEVQWGSELKALTAVANRNYTMDYESLGHYFTYGYTPINRTIYNEVKKLEPAHYFIVDYSKQGKYNITFHEYWKLKTDIVERSHSEWCEEINKVLSESINMHLMSDVPLGAFLSGGIDSSAVVALMSRVAGKQIKTFSIGFGNPKFNELQYARIMAKAYHTEHHELIVDPPGDDFLEQLVSIYDEPYADSSSIPTLILSEFTRKHVTVALSGDGGDELFAGYNDYLRTYYFNKYNKVPNIARPLVWHTAYRAVSQKNIYKRQFYQLAQKNKHMHAYISIYDKYERNHLFTNRVLKGIHQQAEAFKTSILDSFSADNQTNAQALDLMTYMNDDVLCKVDRASMHHSLEVRVPLLDHKFVELAFQIPHSFKLHKGNLKYILKEAMSPYLAVEILSHKKQGFAVPMKNWLTNAMQSKVHSRLLDNKNKIYDYLNFEYVKQVIHNNETSKRKLERHVWTIFMFSEWINSKRANL